jgi:hypothetical protein
MFKVNCFTCGIFSDAVRNSSYVTSKGRMSSKMGKDVADDNIVLIFLDKLRATTEIVSQEFRCCSRNWNR